MLAPWHAVFSVKEVIITYLVCMFFYVEQQPIRNLVKCIEMQSKQCHGNSLQCSGLGSAFFMETLNSFGIVMSILTGAAAERAVEADCYNFTGDLSPAEVSPWNLLSLKSNNARWVGWSIINSNIVHSQQIVATAERAVVHILWRPRVQVP